MAPHEAEGLTPPSLGRRAPVAHSRRGGPQRPCAAQPSQALAFEVFVLAVAFALRANWREMAPLSVHDGKLPGLCPCLCRLVGTSLSGACSGLSALTFPISIRTTRLRASSVPDHPLDTWLPRCLRHNSPPHPSTAGSTMWSSTVPGSVRRLLGLIRDGSNV